ncbi:hypothetical protein MCEMSEM23_02191 [Rhabdaerophilaceae bacterium]
MSGKMRLQNLVRFAMATVLLFSAMALQCDTSKAQVAGSDRQIPLPDGEISRSGLLTAWLIDPTTRYDHGVLGDAIEAGGFIVERAGKRLVYRLPPDAVFEDRRVRLADLDGDGAPEAIIVKSYLNRGAAIAVYRILPDRIEPLAETEAVGSRNRWLNPVGVADFSGTGKPVIAAVVTPHLAGSLRWYSLTGSTLSEIAQINGYTNHIIGKRDLDLARIVKVLPDGPPHIVIPALDRRSLAAISLRGGAAHVARTWHVGSHIDGLKIEAHLQARLATASGQLTVDLKGQ